METKILREWKKVFESDLKYICFELKELLKTPACIILDGNLGAGKTTLVKMFTGEEMLSPTYSIITENKSVVHADFFRIEKKDEIVHLELPLYLENKNFFFAEWGKKYYKDIFKQLPEGYSCYLIEIKTQESQDKKQPNSRNYSLFELGE
jgi:tRNA threonylcarbamoyladenosine biosynthesis protein TsaE